MTPSPSDADKPGPGGERPDAVPAKPEPAATDSRIENKPEAKAEARPEAKSPAPAVGGAKPSQAAAGSTPPKPTPDPAATAKPGDAEPGASRLGDPKPAAAQPGVAKTEPPSPDTPRSDTPRSDPLKPDLPRSGTPGSTPPETPKAASPAAGPKPEPSKTEPSKSDPAKSDPAKPDPAKPDLSKTEPPKPGQTGTGPQAGARSGGPAADAVTDGPIIDLKAKRIPDPPVPGREPSRDAAKEPLKESPRGPAAAAAKPEPSKGTVPPAVPPAAKARPGFGSMAAAGLLGGVIGAGLLFAVEKAGVGADGRLGALDQKVSGRIASLDQRVAGLAPRDAVTALDKRVAAAESSAKQALDKAAGAPAPSAAPSDGQAAAPTPAVPADLVARLDSLDQRVAALQEEPGRDQPADARLGVAPATGQGGAQGDAARQFAALDGRVTALEGGEGAKASAADASKQIAALQGEVEQRAKANAEADAALGQRLDTVQQALDARVKAATASLQAATEASRSAVEAGQTQAAEAAKAVDRRLQEQAEKIAALDKSVAQRAEAGTVQAALRLVVADRVAASLASGAPYAEPLASLRKLGPGADARAAALVPFADTGAPTAARLADDFRPIADGIAAKRRALRAKSAAETGDFRSRLLSMADGLVQVRKVDAPAPEAADDPEGKVQAALDRGDLTAASAAFAALPAEARGQAGDFGAKLEQRARAEEAARTLLADAFKALPTPAAPAASPGR